jgi:hypothetical protein
MSDEFTCAHCRGTFKKGRSDEEAMAECKENFSGAEITEGLDILCDHCFNEFMGWMKRTPHARSN